MENNFAKLIPGGRQVRPGLFTTTAQLTTGEVVPITVKAKKGYVYGLGNARNYKTLGSALVLEMLNNPASRSRSGKGHVFVDLSNDGNGYYCLDSFYTPNPFFGQHIEGWNDDGTPKA